MIQKICKYGDPILKKKAEPVTEFGPELKKFLEDMLETMYANRGVGLAANQVGVLKQAIVIDASTEEQTVIYTLANPKVTEFSKEKGEYEEGCLSFPGIMENIHRPAHVVVKGQDWDGKELTVDGSGFLAVVLQHEIDHLNGITFIDRMSSVKKLLHNKELKEIKAGYSGKKKK
jgi:peptide deformylase